MYRCNVKMYIHFKAYAIDRFIRLFFITLLILLIHTHNSPSISLPTTCSIIIIHAIIITHHCWTSPFLVLISFDIESLDQFSIWFFVPCSMLHDCSILSSIFIYLSLSLVSVSLYYDDEDDKWFGWNKRFRSEKICMFFLKLLCIFPCSPVRGSRFFFFFSGP